MFYRRYWMVAALGLVAGVGSFLRVPYLNPDQYQMINSVVASVSATLLGFVMAAMAILFTIQRARFIQNLQKAGFFQKMIWEFKASAVSMMVALIGAFVGLFLDPMYLGWGIIGTSLFFSIAVGFMWAAGYHFFLVVKYSAD
ncbi:MAG: hypothetical protein H7829_06935 [Magnetococcus sp. THC-1_WYH]